MSVIVFCCLVFRYIHYLTLFRYYPKSRENVSKCGHVVKVWSSGANGLMFVSCLPNKPVDRIYKVIYYYSIQSSS